MLEACLTHARSPSHEHLCVAVHLLSRLRDWGLGSEGFSQAGTNMERGLPSVLLAEKIGATFGRSR